LTVWSYQCDSAISISRLRLFFGVDTSYNELRHEAAAFTHERSGLMATPSIESVNGGSFLGQGARIKREGDVTNSGNKGDLRGVACVTKRFLEPAGDEGFVCGSRGNRYAD